MKKTLTRKILEAHARSSAPVDFAAGADLTVDVDQILIEDATGTMTAMQFEMLGVPQIGVPLAVMYIDHNVLQIDEKNMQDHRYLQSFCAKYGLHYSPPGHGISHYLHMEQFGRPGDVLVGADSHTSMGGALGMLAIGAGGLEVAVAMAGLGFRTTAPRVIGVELTGTLAEGVGAKDVILELLRRHDVRGGRGAIFEFHGAGVRTLSVPERGTICNMIIETGATTGIFPSDELTRAWLADNGREDQWVEITADADAEYDAVETIHLDELAPLVAVPHSPGNVVRVDELDRTEVVQVCVGSSVNSSYDDLATVAAILKGKRIAPGIQLTVTPGSRSIMQQIIASGVYADLAEAGARMLEPICGPCVGIGQAPVATGASLRTFNRNFPGRSGTAEDSVYLSSPESAAATALTGVITTHHGPVPPKRSRVTGSTNLNNLIQLPLSRKERASVSIERGPNLVPPPTPGPLPDDVRGKVLIAVGDDVSTGDMAPDGVIAMSVWSNIDACSQFMFRRLDPEFYNRAREWSGGFIVAGDNYGQGSSREHAALSPLSLGVRAILARSYARIHRRNLIAVGIAPLVLPIDVAAQVGDEWRIDGLRDAIRSGHDRVPVVTPNGGIFFAGIDLSPDERVTLDSGGLLARSRTQQAVG